VSRDDAALVAASARGDRAAFGELVRRHQDRLYNTVYRLVANAEDAQDIVQEAFLSAYQSLPGFKGDSQFFTWLYRIGMNLAISLKRKRHLVLSADTRLVGETGAEPEDQSDQCRPDRPIERAEDEQTLQDALSRLSPEHRVVIVLKELEGHKYETIAEITQVPVGTVRSRLHRARLELRDLLREPGGPTAARPES
jgi:RNA polymerase sigma-70 factor, ECF subfamily